MAGKAKFEIVAEDKTAAAWNSALRTAKTSADKIGGVFQASLAGISFAAIAGVGLRAVEFGDNLAKAATKAGIAGREMSTLAYAAKLADVPLEALSTSLKKMQIGLSEARTGGKDQIETLHALGLEFKDLQTLKPDQQFEVLADRISKLKDPADRTRAAVALFGKAGSDLLPMFEQGAEGIQKARIEAEKLGLSFNDEQLAKISKLDDSVKRMSASWEHFATVIAAKVAPNVTWLMDHMSGVPRTASERVADLEDQLEMMRQARGPDVAGRRAAVLEKLAAARAAVRDESIREMGVALPGSKPTPDVVPRGFTNTAAIEAEKKEQEKFLKDYRDSVRDMNADVDREADDQLKRDNDRWLERQDQARGYYEKWKQSEQDVNEWRETQWRESAAVFRDYFVNAIGDMINTGKFQWRDFLSFMIAEVARRQIGKMFDSIFNSAAANGGGGGGGWFSAIFGAVVNSYAGNVSGALASGSAVEGRANGGDVQAGSVYRINENTPNSELWMPGVSGTVLGRGSLGGVNAPISLTIDARGATEDAIKLLPSFGKQLIDQAEERIVGRLRRDYYGLNK